MTERKISLPDMSVEMPANRDTAVGASSCQQICKYTPERMLRKIYFIFSRFIRIPTVMRVGIDVIPLSRWSKNHNQGGTAGMKSRP